MNMLRSRATAWLTRRRARPASRVDDTTDVRQTCPRGVGERNSQLTVRKFCDVLSVSRVGQRDNTERQHSQSREPAQGIRGLAVTADSCSRSVAGAIT